MDIMTSNNSTALDSQKVQELELLKEQINGRFGNQALMTGQEFINNALANGLITKEQFCDLYNYNYKINMTNTSMNNSYSTDCNFSNQYNNVWYTINYNYNTDEFYTNYEPININIPWYINNNDLYEEFSCIIDSIEKLLDTEEELQYLNDKLFSIVLELLIEELSNIKSFKDFLTSHDDKSIINIVDNIVRYYLTTRREED